MISDKLEVEADSDYFMEPEKISTTTESSFENQGGRSRERTEPEKKMNKLRSIKLSRTPSTRKGRSSSNQFRAKLSGYAASSEQSTPIEMSDATSNHVKTTSTSDAEEENFQLLPVTLTRQSSFKLRRSVTRKSSMKFRRPQLKKSSAGNDLKKELKKSSRREMNSQNDQLSIIQSCEQNKKFLTNEQQKLDYPLNKSIGVLRTSTLGPTRILTKMASLKSKRTKKCSEISSISDPSIERATFSSTLKDSKVPVHVEIKPGGSESDGTAVSNVCRYSYCSLHGHHHGNKPPLKRFVSMRRRVPKSHKSLKPDCQSSGKAKHSGGRKKGLQTEKRVFNGDLGVAVQQTVDIREIPSLIGNESSDFVNLANSVPGEDEDSAIDHGIFQTADPMAGSTTDAACKTETENRKNFTFWKLIYQRVVSGLDAELETQKPLPAMNLEEQVENLHNANEKDDSRADQAMSIEDHEANNRKLELSERDAIKLVQQAFDKILSEIPDHSSHDQSMASDITSDQDFLLKKEDEGKEVSISTSSNSIEDCVVQDREEMMLQTDNKIASEEVKAAKMEGKRPDKQMPNNWSNLKKIMILNRFVKSLEKVRNLKPRTIHNLPRDKDPAAEKIQLRHQNMKGRKNAEEWMLDHALRQVISTLAPSQKRKVAMLVQAFETITPLPENGDDMRSNAAASTPTASVKAYSQSSVHNGDSTTNENCSEILPGKSLSPEISSRDDQHQAGKSHTAYQQIQKPSPEPQETSLLRSCNTEQPLSITGSEMNGADMRKEDTDAFDDNNGNEVSFVTDVHQQLVDLSLSELEEPRLLDKSLNDEGAVRTSDEKFFPGNEEVNQRKSKEEISILNSEVCSEGSELNMKKMDLESNDLINSADQHPGKPEYPKEVGEGAQPKYKFLHSPVELSKSNFSADISKLERQKYTRLWYLIYKHMVSGSATENGFQPLQNVADEEVQGDDANKHSRENNEIVKLVEEAIDEIPLPESQDDTSNNQSITGDVIPAQELPEKKHGEVEVKFISSSTDTAKENSEESKSITAELRSTLNSENVNTQKGAKRGREEGNKPEKRVQRNWSNLKKIILLRRFVKALEKVRNFNPRCPKYLPLDPAPESEKALLRHQNMEDRKNSEEWMLDYALQQVVAKLTPERKRRVELLVEAFETVIPTIS